MNFDFIDKNIPEKDMAYIKKVYKAGYDEGYNEGKKDGYDDCDSEIGYKTEDENESCYDEGYEVGCHIGMHQIIEMLGYDTVRNIQDKTQYQICYGNYVDLNELIEAIKKIAKS